LRSIGLLDGSCRTQGLRCADTPVRRPGPRPASGPECTTPLSDSEVHAGSHCRIASPRSSPDDWIGRSILKMARRGLARTRRWIGPVVAIASALFFCSEVWAETPTDRLRGFFAEATRILEDPETEGLPGRRLAAIHALVADIFDSRGASELALGADW